MAISFSRGSSQLRDRTQDSHTSGRLFHLSHLGIFILSLRGNYMSVVAVQSLSRVRLFMTPCTIACHASLSFTISWSLLKFKSIESVMSSNHLTICHTLLLLPSSLPSIRLFSSERAPHTKLPKYWSFSFGISPSSECSGLISLADKDPSSQSYGFSSSHVWMCELDHEEG